MTPTTKTKQQPKPKPVTQKHPVNKQPTKEGWGEVKTNAEKAAHKDWFGK